MAESQKGASSITDSKKKSPLHEDDNEQDFLNSWKTTAGGKDVLDFNAEAVPRERKKVFDFGKLDDFELDAEFGKLSSFKMDMSDLDFSSPQKKTENSKERLGKEAISGKMEGKRDHFSFSFDFNELDAFDLDTNMLKGEKKAKKCAESDVLDTFENDVRKLSKLGSTNSSNSEDLVSSKMDLDTTDISTTAPAPEDFEKCNVAQGEALTLPEKQMITTQGGKDESNHFEDEREFQVENPLTTGSEKPNAENCVQDFSVKASDYSRKETIQPSQNAGPSSAIVDAYSGEEKHSPSMRSKDYSESGTNSPAKEYDSKGLTALCMQESMITDDKPAKNQSDQKNIGQSSIIFHDSPKMQKDVGDNSVGPVLNETLTGRSNEDKWRSSAKVLESTLHRYSKSEQFIGMKENRGLKLLPLNKDQATGSSATTSKQLYAISKKKTETMNLHPANKKSEDGGNHEQGGNHVSGVFKSLNRNLKVGSIAPESDINHKDSSTSRDIRSTETTNSRKVASVGNRGISLLETDKRHDLSNVNISRNTRSDKYLPNSVMKETTSVDHSKESMVKHPKTSPLAAHSVTVEKSAALSPPLKRKAIEGSHVDPLTLNSSKRILESPSERRKALQISPRTHGQVGLGSETIGGLYNDIYLDHQNSPPDICVDGNTMGLEVSVLIENDGNIEKAEACAKELQNICNMLKRKHEEAKELLVRALVNNNSLLMLDHPIYEEKILALQRFAASLLSKKYDA